MKAGKHGFSGQCCPGTVQAGQHEFSVGVFQWVPTRSGMCLKKSAVKVRVIGSTSDPDRVYAKALEIVEQLDAGTYAGPKRVRVTGATRARIGCTT